MSSPTPTISFHDSTPSPPNNLSSSSASSRLSSGYLHHNCPQLSSLLRRRSIHPANSSTVVGISPPSVDISTDLYAFVVSPEHSPLFESTLLTHPHFQPFHGCSITLFVKLDHLSQWRKWLSFPLSLALGRSLTPDRNTARARKSTSTSWSSATSTAASLLALVSPPSEAEFALPLNLTNRFLVG